MGAIGLSVIIPAYNQAPFLPQALESVLGQTRQPDEIIVVDDGSTDGTEAVCRQYNGRVEYIRQKNSGPAGARNTGVDRSSGEAVLFLDADDVLARTWVEGAVQVLERERARGGSVGAVYGSSIYFDDAGTYRRAVPPARISAKYLLREPPIMSGVLTSRRCLEDTGRFDEGLRICEDWDYWLRVALRGHRFVRVRHLAFLRRMHDASLTRDELALLRWRARFFDLWLGRGWLEPGQETLLRRELARNYLLMRRAAYYRGEPTDLLVERAVQADPEILLDPWIGVYGAVYRDPRRVATTEAANVVESIELLYRDLTGLGRLPRGSRHVSARLRASRRIALATDRALRHHYWSAIEQTARALLADPSASAGVIRRVVVP